MDLTWIKFSVPWSRARALGVVPLGIIQSLAVGGALAQEVGTPPPATNPRPSKFSAPPR